MRAWWIALAVVLQLAGCAGGGGARPSGERPASAPAATPGSGERYAMAGDAYPEEPPDVREVPDAVPRIEPPSRGGNRPSYEVWGKTYQVLPDARGYARQGTASWYGEKFHGYATSNGEIYDMYKMSAAHRSLPLPSFVRVTSLDNGNSVIVRVNDRGPFHSDREIDLSYAAAARLDILDRGTGRVKVEAIDVERWLAENGSAGAPSGGAAQGNGADRQAASVRVAELAHESAAVVAPAPVARAETRPSAASDSGATEHRAADGRPIYLQVAALGSAESAQALKARLQDELSHPVRVASATGLHRVQVGPLAHAGQVAPVRDELRRAGFDQAFVVNGVD
ncbi:septal ring lytic transglycosylase RlpA family protein [Halomonas sp. LBP4]|uniref:septal ring lytic transglycosylase RlpA family protein n=1 Tax=Halomonas sp. LBP4 TaxID=2044917 RepID=UPI000D751E5B|nr:septal ring lytic transglycosylase RlpA family protein [Halomonas sp. LBP4]PXX97470.1 septal ring lytic transglycosylase RlpA [Halomonas sp. LBP4]